MHCYHVSGRQQAREVPRTLPLGFRITVRLAFGTSFLRHVGCYCGILVNPPLMQDCLRLVMLVFGTSSLRVFCEDSVHTMLDYYECFGEFFGMLCLLSWMLSWGVLGILPF